MTLPSRNYPKKTHTPEELEDIRMMQEIAKSNPNLADTRNPLYNVGSSGSDAQEEVAQDSFNAINEERQQANRDKINTRIITEALEKMRSGSEEQKEAKQLTVEDLDLENMVKPTVPPSQGPEAEEDEPFMNAIKEDNAKVEFDNMSTIQKLYVQELDKDNYSKIQEIDKQIDAINQENSKGDSFLDFVGNVYKKYTTGWEDSERIKELKKQKQALTAPADQLFTKMVEMKVDKFNKENTGPFVTDAKSATDYLLRKSAMLANSNSNDAGFWDNLFDSTLGKGSKGLSTLLGTAELSANLELISLSKRINDTPDFNNLSAEDKELIEAYSLYQSSQALNQSTASTVGRGVGDMVPFMVQLLSTRALGASVSKGTEMALRKGMVRMGLTGLESQLAKQALQFASRKAVPALTSSLAAASAMPITYGDIARRYAGEIDVERDAEGNINDAAMGQKLYDKLVTGPGGIDEQLKELEALPKTDETEDRIDALKEQKEDINKSLGRSIYEGLAANTIEVLTERVGGEIIAKQLAKAGFRLPNVLPQGAASQRLADLKKGVGFDGFGAEYIEELMVTPLNATFVGDSKYSDLWDGQQQLNTALTVAATSGLMSVPGALLQLNSRARNPEFYQRRKELLNRAREIQEANPEELSTMFNLGNTFQDIVDMQQNQEKLREEGKHEEAKLLGETLLYNQALQAFSTGTHEEFIKALDKTITRTDIDEDTRENAVRARAEVGQLERTYNQFKKLPNINNIMALQTNKILGRRAIQETEKKLAEVEPDAKADILAYLEANNITPPPFDMPTLFTANFEDPAEQEEYNKFIDTLQSADLMSVNQFENMTLSNQIVDQMLTENRTLFNEQVHKDYQKKLDTERNLRKELFKSLGQNKNFLERNFVSESDLETSVNSFDYNGVDAALEQILKKYKGKLSEERINEVKDEFLTAVATRQQAEELRRQALIDSQITPEDNPQSEVPAEMPAEQVEGELDKPVATVESETPESNNTEELAKAQKELDTLSSEITKEDTEGAELYFSLDEEKFYEDDLPRQLSENLDDPKKQIIKQRVQKVHDIIMDNSDGKQPSFEQFIESAISMGSKQQAEEFFNVYALGWELNGYPKADYRKVYNKLFNPLEGAFAELNDEIFVEPVEGDVFQETQDVIEQQNNAEAPITGFDELNVPIRSISNDGFMTITPNLKLGFLSIRYTQAVDENGNITRTADESELNNDAIIDFKRLLDPNKFNGGQTLTVGIPAPEVMDRIMITEYNQDGTKKSSLYADWLNNKLQENPNFKDTIEYVATVPVMAFDTDGTAIAYIHDSNWYNTTNVGPRDNESMQTLNIQEGRQNVIALRNQILNGSVNQINIDSKHGEVFHVLPGAETMSLLEANPQSVVVVAKQKGLAYVTPNELFESPTRTILNSDTIKPNTAYDLRQIGVDATGRKTYLALPVFSGVFNDAPNGKYWSVPEQTFGTLQQAFKAFGALNNMKSYFTKRKVQLPTEQEANDIVNQVLRTTGYDISSRDDINKFFQLYTNKFTGTKFDYNSIADHLYGNTSDQMKFGRIDPNTSLNGMETNPRMVNIDENGVVTPTGETYQEFLKSTMLTSNVKSFNIGTEEKPVFATAIQPSITFSYDVNSNYTPQSEEQMQEKSVAEIAQEAATAAVIEMEEANPELAILSKAKNLISNLGFNQQEDFDDLPTEITDTTIIQRAFNTVDGLNPMQEFQLVDFIFNSVAASVGFTYKDNIDKEELLRSIRTKYNEIAGPSKVEVTQLLSQLQGLDETKYPEVESLKQEYQRILDVYQSIEDNWVDIERKSLEKLYKYTGIKDGKLEEDPTKLDTESQREKDYSKTSLEENGKGKTSYRLRRFMAGVQDRTPNGEIKKGFLNVPTFVGFNEVYDKVAQILSSPVEIESNFDLMIQRLSENSDTHTWIPELIDKLKNADNQIKKEFVYNYTKHSLSMKFAMYSVDGKGNYSLKIYDTNAHEITRLIRDSWRSNFIFSPLVNKNSEAYSINQVYAKILLDEFNSWQPDPQNVDHDKVKAWLANFGIVLSRDAFNKIVNDGIYYKRQISYADMFTGKDTVFGLLHSYLLRMTDPAVKNTEFEENENNHPFTDMGGVLNSLSLLESKYTNQSMTLSFRDNGKSIFGLTPNKFVTDRILKLKQYDPNTGTNPLVQQLRNLSLSNPSYVLALLDTDPDFRGKFQVDHNGITALRQQGRKVSPFSNITDLTSNDHEIAKLTGFQDTRQGTVNATVGFDGTIQKGGNGISMRMGRMFLPTMSDKSQMLMLSTGVFNFYKDKRKSFDVDASLDFGFTESLQNLLYNQLVTPELKRIIKFHTTVKATNIKDYDAAAQIFNFIPALNTIQDENGINLVELIANDPVKFNEEYVATKYKAKFNAVLKEVADNQVSKKLNLWEQNIERKKDGSDKGIKFFDKDYLDQSAGGIREKLKTAAYDFVLNSFITNANMFTIIAGDPAIYSQDKLFSGFKVNNILVEGAFKLYGKPELFKPSGNYKAFMAHMETLLADGKITKNMYNDITTKVKPMSYSGTLNDYNKLSKLIGVNIGKRLALLIAPGNKIADSKGSKYMQIFLKDAVHISENIEYKIGLYYSAEELSSVRGTLSEYKDPSTTETRRKQIRKSLRDKFPAISDYFDIESTDAQEYTTAMEHIGILEGQGRIPSSILNTVKEKIKLQKELEADNKPFTNDSLITKEEMDIVFQPIKPVHTGQTIDEKQDVARTVYVKSSSFPLIPQFTKGRNIDALRRKLEQLEDKFQMPVRASYQTANKVGAMNNPIDPFNSVELENAELASLVLDRDNFRIQQDVPFKSDMKKEDKVSMGTQIFKLLFGDGMLNQDGFTLDGNTMTGRDLYDHFNTKFADLIAVKKKMLYNELELNEDGTPKDAQKSFTKLQDMLQREARDRGYPRQDIEALAAVTNEEGTVIPLYDINRNEYYDFKLPLWISANSNRYEALLNAIVTNRIISQKLPGNAFVVGSEEGLEVTEDVSRAGSRVIHVNGFTGGELKGVQDVNGQFQYAQVYVPSKFKDENGKLIDLYQRKGKDYVYLNIGDNGQLTLKDDMVSKDLLSFFSFRTPTSSHVSGSIIEIAGILPPEMGDLMIVPKHFTKQKGLDYDVDKETAYSLWNRVMPNGMIKTLDEQYKIEILDMIRNQLVRKNNLIDVYEASAFNNMMEALFGQEEFDAAITEAETNVEQKLERFSDKLDQKLLENEFVKVHKAVFSNPNKEVQRKINKVLSMDFAKSSADYIDELNQQGTQEAFTILSDEYQKDKMALGAAGKLAIGVYSNYVTFHGLSQQTPQKIQLVDEETGDPKDFTFGNLKSTGVIGEETTLDGDRSIAEAFAEKQNTATDNEKEQILGRVNINGFTINVDSLLTLLGFDKVKTSEDKDISLSYLFLSQPIIKDYVRLMSGSQAITAEFMPNRENLILNQLIDKYRGNTEPTVSGAILAPEMFEALTKEMTSEMFVENILGRQSIEGFQLAVLQQFLELDKYAKQIGNLQSVVNTTDLGKSIAESNDKYDKLKSLYSNPLIKNGQMLIGDYVSADNYEPEIHIGYINFDGDVYIKPNTPQGQIVVNGIKTGNDLWNKYFLYNNTHVRKVMSEIGDIINAEQKSSNRQIELKHDIMKEIKKYFNSFNKSGVFTDTASQERERLFIDTDTNKSLARYINELKYVEIRNVEGPNKRGVFNIKKNKLVNKFEFTLNSNREPSIIKYNSTTTENFDEDYLYTAIPEMIINNDPLPDFNGKPYTTRMLAGDLVTYAFVEGGAQEAIQFMKYVPVEYLETVGFTKTLQGFSPMRNGSLIGKALGTLKNDGSNVTSSSSSTYEFVKQYIQHNPEMATQYTSENQSKFFQGKKFSEDKKVDSEGNDVITKKLEGFTLMSDDVEYPKFISIKNVTKSKRAQEKFSLFQHTGNGEYNRISVLGMHGMSEYQLGNKNAVSLLENVIPMAVSSKPSKVDNSPKEVTDTLNIRGGNIEEILENIQNSKFLNKYKHLGKVAKFLQPMTKNNVFVVVGDTSMDGAVAKAAGRTSYGKDNDGKPYIRIMIDEDVMQNNDQGQIARTFIHEFIHSVTSQELSQYFDRKTGKQIQQNLPPHISRLKRIFEETKKTLGPELDALAKKRQLHLDGELPSNTAYTAEDLEVTYAGTSIFEFVTTALTEPEFQRRMNEINFKNTGNTLWDSFKNVIINILYSVGVPLKQDGITYEALSATLDFISIENLNRLNNNVSSKNTNFAQSQSQADAITLADIEKELQQGKPTRATEFDGVDGFDLPIITVSDLPDVEC